MRNPSAIDAGPAGGVDDWLFKVARPRDTDWFYPSTFWRTADWESSTLRYRPGYQRDCVLYAGDREEIGIHLLPRDRTIRVRAVDLGAASRVALGLESEAGITNWLWVHDRARARIDGFRPSIFCFERDGFQRVRRGEYVAREPRRAVYATTLELDDALDRAGARLVWTEDLEAVSEWLTGQSIYFDVQTGP